MAAEIVDTGVSSVASKVAKSFYDIVEREISYVFKYQRYKEELKNQLVKLKTKKEMMEQVKRARRQGDQIYKSIEEWQMKVEFIERVEESMDEEEEKAQKKQCLKGFCPNLMTRYNLNKKAVKATKDVVDLLKQVADFKFDPERTELLQDIEGYQQFDSRVKIFQDVIDELKESKYNKIGVYGVGGVGKTTLAKQVAKKVLEEKLFDKVVMAEVTQTPDLKTIQDKIAYDLDIVLDQNLSFIERSGKLSQRLDKEKRVLVILDNVWGKFNLEDVGIHSGVNNVWQCTILLTSRSRDVLCNEMNSQKNFSIDVLSEEESMGFFWKNVGDHLKEMSDFQSLAVEIVGIFRGLPIVIKTFANALKHKSLPLWEDALNKLRHSNARRNQGMDAEVYSSIELSYNFLQSEEAKSLFRLCALQKNGSRIPINDLIMYGMGLSLFTNVYTMEGGRHTVYALIDTLKSSSLLLDGDTEVDVKMHDIVHAVAVSIAKDEFMLTIRNVTDLKEELENGIQEDATAISLPYRDIQWLPERLKCPKLKLLLLFAKHGNSLQIPDLFFEGMKELIVLHVTEICLLSLPSSLGFLVNLRTLVLANCYSLNDVAIVGELKKLEILSFRDSDIEELPIEIGQLTQLRLLDLQLCSRLTLIQPNVIPKLSQLEELYMGNSFTQWEKFEGQLSNASLVELKELSNLKVVDIHIPNIEVMPQDLFCVELERYKISIGDHSYRRLWSSKYETSKSLKIEVNNRLCLGAGIQMWVKRAEDLCLKKLNGFQSVLPELDEEGFPRLKHLFIQYSPEILYIVNSMRWPHCNAFPLLESLFLYKLIKLEKICQGHFIKDKSFSHLRTIVVKSCHNLNHLFTFSMAKNLFQLQEIQVSNCRDLKMIVAKESEIHLVHKNESLRGIYFTQLRSLSLEWLPQLTNSGFDLNRPEAKSASTSMSQEIIAGDDLKTLFNNMVIFPNVEKLKLLNINVEKLWVDQFPAISSCSQYLTKLTVKGCHNLRFLFSSSMVNSLVQLQELFLCNCESIEEVIDIRLLGKKEESIEVVFPKLVRLLLYDLPELTTFGITISIEFPSLRELWIGNCNNLKRFISSSTPMEGMSSEKIIHTDTQLALFDEKIKLPSLEMLIFDRMALRKIWHHQLALDSFSKLRDLRLKSCYGLVNIFPSNMCRRLGRLERLVVHSCDQLKEIIGKSSCNGIEVPRPRFVFPRLTSLKLINLSSLKNFYSVVHISEFPVLEELNISRCNNMKTLASELMNQGENQHEMAIQQHPFFLVKKAGLSTLKKLTINAMVKLKIWHNMQVASESDTVGALQNLEELEVSSCEIEYINELIETATELKRLRLYRLDNLKEVWPISGHGNRFQACQNLISIYVSDLGSMKTLFPASVARGLFQLEKLEICSLDELEEIVAKEEGEDQVVHISKFVFPRLISLKLNGLSRLKSFCKGKHISDWPMLKKLEVHDCGAVKILASSEFMNQESQQPLFLVDHKVAFPRLEELDLYKMYTLVHLWKENSHPCKVFQNLRILRVIRCSALQQSVPSSVYLQYLTTLDVSYCDELRNSVTVSSNLTTMNVEFCNKLKKLVKLSTTEMKVKLERIKIDSCKMLENILELEVGEDVKEGPIVFIQLEYLKLDCCPRLRSCCSGNYNTLEFPYLKEVVIHWCPRMKIFFEGVLHTPKLCKVQYTYKKDEGCWEGDLNSSIQKMFEEMVGYNGIESLKLSEFPELKEIWHSQALPASFFSNLRLLEVDDCTFMLRAIPTNLLGFLKKLKTLAVRNCDSVEEVFDLKEVKGNDEHIGTLFPKLQRLVLLDLPELKRFCNFTKDRIKLRKLSQLWIENCPTMETFVSDSTQVDITTNKEPQDMQPLFNEKVVSLRLKKLKLSKLPRLSHLCKEKYHPSNLLKNLKILELSECHKLQKFVPSLESFKNLRTLKVSNCHRLKILGTL